MHDIFVIPLTLPRQATLEYYSSNHLMHMSTAAPIPAHAVEICPAPVFMTHRSAVQWGALTLSGDIASPERVIGKHKCTYA